MSENSLLSQIRQLPISEQVDLMRDVWDSLVDSGETVGLTHEQQRDLDQRLQRHQESPDDVVSWEQARREIERTSE
jgi:putative addiction module component (TIGR02574 family)